MNEKEFLDGAQQALDQLRRRKRAPDVDALVQYVGTIAENVRAGRLPPKPNRRAKSMGWILVDDWDPADPLGARILELNDYYLNL